MHTFTFYCRNPSSSAAIRSSRLLNTDRQPDRVGSDSLLRQFFLCTLAVGSGSRMDHQGFYVCHIGQQGEDRQIVDKGPRLSFSSLDLKSKDGASALGKILFVECMRWFAFKGRMMHSFYFWMPGQILYDLPCIFHIAALPGETVFPAPGVTKRHGRARVWLPYP